jgi:hypothetical protein
MSDYNAYGELYDQRPELIIHERLKNSGTVRELINIAQENNFRVCFGRGPLRQDTMIKWHDNENKRPECYSMSSALRYFKQFSSR